MTEEKFPLGTEELLIGLSRLFVSEGATREVAVLSNTEAEVIVSSYDNWNGGFYYYGLHLKVPSWLFSIIAKDREGCEQKILEGAKLLIRPYGSVDFDHVYISPSTVVDPAWREKAQAWLSGQGVNNQGRVRSDNIPSRTRDGLLFRSDPEIFLYIALKNLGVSFAPLPVFIRGGETYRRIEPDFVIIKDGMLMVVEVDGDTFHHETPAEAYDRTTMLVYEGVHVERVKASECATQELANVLASKLLKIIEKLKHTR